MHYRCIFNQLSIIRFARNVWGLQGQGKQLALDGINALENFFKENGIPMSLSEVNIDETYFKQMAEHANRNDRLAKAYVPLTPQDIIEIYKACL